MGTRSRASSRYPSYLLDSQKGQLIVRELLGEPLFEFFALFNYYSDNGTR
jgi:hypothetical protein